MDKTEIVTTLIIFRQFNHFYTDCLQIKNRLSTDYLQIIYRLYTDHLHVSMYRDYILTICLLSTGYIQVL